MELVCPGASLPAINAALNNGADAIYLGLNDDTNASLLLNSHLNQSQIENACKHVKLANKKLYFNVNALVHSGSFTPYKRAVDFAVKYQADAIVASDLAVLNYINTIYPNYPIHLSVLSTVNNKEAIKFYQHQFNIKRIELSQSLPLNKMQQLAYKTDIEVEVFGFGNHCIMLEGQCNLATYVRKNHTDSCVQEMVPKLLSMNNKHFLKPPVCAHQFELSDNKINPFAQIEKASKLTLLPKYRTANIRALKIDGRSIAPTKLGKITRVWREAIDELSDTSKPFVVKQCWLDTLTQVSESINKQVGMDVA